MQQLTSLSLACCQQLDDAALAVLATLSSLQALCLERCKGKRLTSSGGLLDELAGCAAHVHRPGADHLEACVDRVCPHLPCVTGCVSMPAEAGCGQKTWGAVSMWCLQQPRPASAAGPASQQTSGQISTCLCHPSPQRLSGTPLAAMRRGPVLAGFEALGALTALEELNVAFTAASQGSMLSWTRLTRLRVLNMDSCEVNAKCAGPAARHPLPAVPSRALLCTAAWSWVMDYDGGAGHCGVRH